MIWASPLCLCVTSYGDLASASISSDSGQGLDSGSSCPLLSVKPHAWACRSLAGSLPLCPLTRSVAGACESGEVQGGFSVGCMDTWTSAKPRASRTFQRLMGHAQRSPMPLFFCPPQRRPALLFQILDRILCAFSKFLLTCLPLAHKASRAPLYLTGEILSAPLHSHSAYLFPSGDKFCCASALSGLSSPEECHVSFLSPLTGLGTEQVFNPGLKVLLAGSCPELGWFLWNPCSPHQLLAGHNFSHSSSFICGLEKGQVGQ